MAQTTEEGTNTENVVMRELRLEQSYTALARDRGLSGEELANYVDKRVKETLDREERARNREDAKSERQRQNEREEREAAAKRAFQIEMEGQKTRQLQEAEKTKQFQLQLQLQETQKHPSSGGHHVRIRYPSMPNFDESKDLMDTYLYRFEQHAAMAGWGREVWSTCLSAHLTGLALQVMQSLSDNHGKVDYDVLKDKLLQQFACTTEDARLRFRRCKPDQLKTGEAIAGDMERALRTWMDRAKVTSKEQLMDIILQEQLIDSVAKDLSIFLVEQDAKSFKEMTALIDRFRKAHPNKPIARKIEHTAFGAASFAQQQPNETHPSGGTSFYRTSEPHAASKTKRNSPSSHRSGGVSKTKKRGPFACFICSKRDHGIRKCPKLSDKQGFDMCFANAAMGDDSASNSTSSDHSEAGSALILSSAMDGHIGSLKLESGFANNQYVSVLRDSGANVCGIRKTLVDKAQYTGKSVKCRSFGGNIEIFQTADVNIASDYITGVVRCCVLEDPIADLIIGNIPGI